MITNDTIVVLTTAALHLPTNLLPAPGAAHLAGVSLLIARSEADGWRFDLAVKAASAGDGEEPLLAWMLNELPPGGQVVGWRLSNDVIPALLGAADDAEAELSQAFLQRLYALFTTPSDDLSLDHGGAAAPPLGAHLIATGLMSHSLAADAIWQAWTNARAAPVVAQLKAEAVALLHLWVMRSPDRAGLRVAFGRWLAEQRAAGVLT